MEHFLKELRRHTANWVFDNKQQVENLLKQLVLQYQRAARQNQTTNLLSLHRHKRIIQLILVLHELCIFSNLVTAVE